MKRIAAVILIVLSALTPVPARADEGGSVKSAFYYKVKWGYQAEFEALFFKNYYPVLEAQIKDGKRVKAVDIYRPTYHGDGRADWTFLVVMTYISAEASVAPSHDDVIIKRLYADQEKYKKEEARRFEILDAHWDVPLTAVEPPAKR
ncbi:MAG: hypothetical protein ABI672_16600 [Vicinamibacteria bacterium]